MKRGMKGPAEQIGHYLQHEAPRHGAKVTETGAAGRERRAVPPSRRPAGPTPLFDQPCHSITKIPDYRACQPGGKASQDHGRRLGWRPDECFDRRVVRDQTPRALGPSCLSSPNPHPPPYLPQSFIPHTPPQKRARWFQRPPMGHGALRTDTNAAVVLQTRDG
ncbi:unnamed protein product [Boreogadus saida]